MIGLSSPCLSGLRRLELSCIHGSSACGTLTSWPGTRGAVTPTKFFGSVRFISAAYVVILFMHNRTGQFRRQTSRIFASASAMYCAQLMSTMHSVLRTTCRFFQIVAHVVATYFCSPPDKNLETTYLVRYIQLGFYYCTIWTILPHCLAISRNNPSINNS